MDSDKQNIIEVITRILKEKYSDFKGLYFFGSRVKGNAEIDSDYDVVLLFDDINVEKKMSVFGLLSEIEYKNNVFFDVKFLSTSGKRSIEYIRKNINPYFIKEAIDNGVFYG